MDAGGGRRLLYVGLMSGTSMDGIDAAAMWVEGGGRQLAGSFFLAYDLPLRTRLQLVVESCGREGDVLAVQRDLTKLHAEAVRQLLSQSDIAASEVEAVGFHGHTVVHRPAEGITWQIGDAQLLCHLTGIDVVSDFRSRDVAMGGQGAPLLPLYHVALVRGLPPASDGKVARRVAVLNVGGVANVTFVPHAGEEEVMACDTGPGNALLDDWMRRCTDGAQLYDRDGECARQGAVQKELLAGWLAHPYFSQPAPKSLDRNSFHATVMAEGAGGGLLACSMRDGAATLLQLTVETIALAAAQWSAGMPDVWVVAGGGRLNSFLVERLCKRLQQDARCEVLKAEQVGWDGDMVEAEGYVRRLACCLPVPDEVQLRLLGPPLLPGAAALPAIYDRRGAACNWRQHLQTAKGIKLTE